MKAKNRYFFQMTCCFFVAAAELINSPSICFNSIKGVHEVAKKWCENVEGILKVFIRSVTLTREWKTTTSPLTLQMSNSLFMARMIITRTSNKMDETEHKLVGINSFSCTCSRNSNEHVHVCVFVRARVMNVCVCVFVCVFSCVCVCVWASVSGETQYRKSIVSFEKHFKEGEESQQERERDGMACQPSVK